MRKIAITISKGGAGKSTTCVNLAAALADQGKRVLLVDTDTQGHVATMLGLSPSAGLAELIVGQASKEEAVVEARPNLWLLAGGKKVAGLKQLIAKKEFAAESTIKEGLECIEGEFDFVLLDTSPGWDSLLINVLFYARELLLPVSTEVLTLKSVIDFTERVREILRYNPQLSISYVVPTFFDQRVKKSSEIIDQLALGFGEVVCNPIRYSVRLSEAPGFGKTIFEYDPKSRGAQDYLRLAERISTNGHI